MPHTNTPNASFLPLFLLTLHLLSTLSTAAAQLQQPQPQRTLESQCLSLNSTLTSLLRVSLRPPQRPYPPSTLPVSNFNPQNAIADALLDTIGIPTRVGCCDDIGGSLNGLSEMPDTWDGFEGVWVGCRGKSVGDGVNAALEIDTVIIHNCPLINSVNPLTNLPSSHPNLTQLSLTSTQLTHPFLIPNLPLLETLELDSNNLTGAFTPLISRLTNLQVLSIAYNPQLSGPIPPSLSLLPNLRVFSAFGTSLTPPFWTQPPSVKSCVLPKSFCELGEGEKSLMGVCGSMLDLPKKETTTGEEKQGGLWSSTRVLALGVGIVVFVLTISALIFVCIQTRKRNEKKKESLDSGLMEHGRRSLRRREGVWRAFGSFKTWVSKKAEVSKESAARRRFERFEDLEAEIPTLSSAPNTSEQQQILKSVKIPETERQAWITALGSGSAGTLNQGDADGLEGMRSGEGDVVGMGILKK
ncbi:hypothetical protein HDV05_007927 [Chytridiales sp. JEL 0842]|nr:hypothetical protein HDV05_007927 [Chytridiales sp. JEL 0842]